MLATFCLRLACGLAGSLLLFPAGQVNPRFYRTHFLTVLALTAAAGFVEHQASGPWFWVPLSAAMVFAFLGSVSWVLEGAPGGFMLTVFTTLALALTMLRSSLDLPDAAPSTNAAAQAPEAASRASDRDPAAPVHALRTAAAGLGPVWLAAEDLTSAALLGTATTAMLIGHSYLIAPGMSLTPLLRMLIALFAAIGFRSILAGIGLWFWTSDHSLGKLEQDAVLWLPLRWGLGFIAPAILGWMAWTTARMRSTQSATGILYVVVIFCFLGELTSQLLLRNTGYAL